MIPPTVPKVLFNMENTGETGGFDFDRPKLGRLFIQGECDKNILKLVKDVGWDT